MRNDSFTRNILIFSEEFKFTSGSHMRNMQMSPRLLCQFNSQTTTFVTSLYTTDFRMEFHIRIFTIFFLIGSHIAIDDVSILAMSHHRQSQILGFNKYLLQRLILIHQHIARAGTHKEFNTRNTMNIQSIK